MSDDETLPRYYSNAVRVSSNLHDIMVTFIQVDNTSLPPAPPVAEQNVRPVCQVIMSYPHVKAVLPILSRIVANYEEQFGIVPAPGIVRE